VGKGRAFVAVLAAGFALLAAAHAENAVLPIGDALCASMEAHHVLNPGAPVGCERLRLIKFDYVDFAGAEHGDGEIVVMDAVADRVLRIFRTLHARKFPVARARPMDAYEGDDGASMADDNTSGFNHREVEGGGRLSLHAYGLAIDLNPVENPYVTRDGATYTFKPTAGADYFNRQTRRPGKPDRRGAAEQAVDIFAENGFLVWGGNWDSPVDYQHFDVGRAMAETLAALPPAEAGKKFEQSVAQYRKCRRERCRGGRVANGCDIPCK
jgi:hypothetical protein